jgi:hypothetical protein
MSTRREFLKHAALSSALVGVCREVRAGAALERPTPTSKARPDVVIPQVNSFIRRDETIVRYGGNGDVYPMTWSADDLQFSALLDGSGWSQNAKGVYNTRLFSIDKSPRNAIFRDVDTYPDLLPIGKESRYYGFGVLALDERIYQFLCALEPSERGWRWVGTKLIYSPDKGRTWCNQDGSTPVVWESYQARSRKTLLFWKEPNDAFSLLSVLQMGKNYGENRDGYVYLYSTNGFTDGLMNQLVVARVPKALMLKRDAYEFFSGMGSDGSAKWSENIEGRAVSYTFPRGWVNTMNGPDTMVAQSWLPSVTYNAPLGLYMMANWGDGCASDGSWFGKPSYLGFWVASNPWGPWTQIHEETAWMPKGDRAARCYSPQIAPKWIAPDGKSFWLVWTDFQGHRQWIAQWKRAGIPFDTQNRGDLRRMNELMRGAMPYYAFNTQRVDLGVRRPLK